MPFLPHARAMKAAVWVPMLCIIWSHKAYEMKLIPLAGQIKVYVIKSPFVFKLGYYKCAVPNDPQWQS
ncbi:MAG: hypothetical protein ACI965_000112 [Paraglaciecola sp.]|jgi:hypothetical protein